MVYKYEIFNHSANFVLAQTNNTFEASIKFHITPTMVSKPYISIAINFLPELSGYFVLYNVVSKSLEWGRVGFLIAWDDTNLLSRNFPHLRTLYDPHFYIMGTVIFVAVKCSVLIMFQIGLYLKFGLTYIFISFVCK